MYKKIIFLIFTSILLLSCNKSENSISEVELIVASEYRVDIDWVSGEDRPFLQIKEVGSSDDYWSVAYGIEGFDYESGYEYLLRVYKIKTDERLQDVPDHTYKLIKIISKTKAENLPLR